MTASEVIGAGDQIEAGGDGLETALAAIPPTPESLVHCALGKIEAEQVAQVTRQALLQDSHDEDILLRVFRQLSEELAGQRTTLHSTGGHA